MSVLATPRLYFNGKCTWDPIVTNNSANYWDIATSKPIEPLTSATTYRSMVDNQIASNGNWNPHGTHRSVFYETFAQAVDMGNGRSTADAIVNIPVNLSAMLVDVDPYVANTSQLFYDELKIGIDGGPQIRMPNNGPMVGRYINFRRNNSLEIAGHASVIWQTSCVKDLQILPHDSPVLMALKTAVDSGEATGLTIRINAYRTIYFDVEPPIPQPDPRYKALQNRVKGGGFQPNPARSWIVGVVGLHRDGEPLTSPGDRRLTSSVFGTAFARLNKKTLVLDLANTIPEKNPQGDKDDVGDIAVTAGGTNVGTLTPSDYDKAAYEATAGLVSLDLSDAQAAAVESGELVLSPGSATAISEQPLTAVIEPPNIYLEGLDAKKVVVQVFRNGRPIEAAMSIKIQVAEVDRDPDASPKQVEVVDLDASGTAEIEFSSKTNAQKFRLFDGSSQWVITPFEGAEPSAPGSTNTGADCYLAVRVTPADDDIAALPPTWENVHQKVLIDWEALAPCMDNWLKLGDEQQCRSMAPLLKKLTSLGYFNNFTYMPVTRGLTKGQRTLLHNWCDAPESLAPSLTRRSVGASATEAMVATDKTVDLSRGFSRLDET